MRTTILRKVGVYYGLSFLTVISIGVFYPEGMQFLPFGGLDSLHLGPSTTNGGGLEDPTILSERPVKLFDDALNLYSALAGVIIVMLPIRWIYMMGSPTKAMSKDVATSLLVLPLVVAAIVYVVKYSLPLAFALTGIFAGVRYRTTLKHQSDAYFTFASIAVGLAAGTRSLGIGLLLATFFSFTIVLATPDDQSSGNAE